MSVFFATHLPIIYAYKHIACTDPAGRSAHVPLNKQRPTTKTNIIKTAMVTAILTKLIAYNQYIWWLSVSQILFFSYDGMY